MPPLVDESETESSSGSSDQFRGEQTRESSETSEDEEFQETFLSQLPINEMVMRKGEWRHVKGNASKIREHMQEELERRQKSRLDTVPGTSKSALAVSTAESVSRLSLGHVSEWGARSESLRFAPGHA